MIALVAAVLMRPDALAVPVGHHGSASGGEFWKNVGFTPASHPVHVTADTGHIIGLDYVRARTPIRLANGKMSAPDTYYIRFQYLLANNAAITQHVNGRSLALTNKNGSDLATAARLGAPAGTLEVWTRANSLKLCVTAETFYTLVSTWKGSFQGRIDEVFALIAQVFAPFVGQPLGKTGPCIQLKELLPLLAVIVQAGVPIPKDLPGTKVDLDVYAVHIKAPREVSSLSLPMAEMVVESD